MAPWVINISFLCFNKTWYKSLETLKSWCARNLWVKLLQVNKGLRGTLLVHEEVI